MNLLEEYKSKTDVFCNPSQDGHLVSVKYANPNVPWEQELYRQARGIILDANTGEVLARPYDKFFNFGQVLATPELSERFSSWHKGPAGTFTVTEKVDGSLAIMYDDHGTLRIGSSGSPIARGLNANERTTGPGTTPWIDIFKKLYSAETVEKLHKIAKVNTIIFEFVTPEHTIVIPHDKEEFILHGMRNTITGDETSFSGIKKLLEEMDIHDIPLAREYPEMKSFEDINKLLPTLHNFEGFVIRWDDGYRLKMKTEEYVRAHHTITLFGTPSLRKAYLWVVMNQMEILDDLSAQYANNPFTQEATLKAIRDIQVYSLMFVDMVQKAKLSISRADTRKEIFSKDRMLAYVTTGDVDAFRGIINALLSGDDEKLRRQELKYVTSKVLPDTKVRSIGDDTLTSIKKDLDYFVPENEGMPYKWSETRKEVDDVEG